ncbi:hypothetical protein M758_3G195000 [Ceratodon purpureus]|nr:hypothetical protein M758_3G195000 [Ceratodon purpureus]
MSPYTILCTPHSNHSSPLRASLPHGNCPTEETTPPLMGTVPSWLSTANSALQASPLSVIRSVTKNPRELWISLMAFPRWSVFTVEFINVFDVLGACTGTRLLSFLTVGFQIMSGEVVYI